MRHERNEHSDENDRDAATEAERHEAGEAGETGRAYVRSRRRCLRCEATFDSAWSGERICPSCKHSAAWRAGQPTPLNAQRSRGIGAKSDG